MGWTKETLFLLSLFSAILILSDCKNLPSRKSDGAKLVVNLDSVIMVSNPDENPNEQLIPLLYYYFTCTNLYPDSVLTIEIEKFKDYDITKDSLVVYYNNKRFKLYTSYRSNIFKVTNTSPHRFTLSPDPGELLESVQNEQNIIESEKLSDYIKNAELVLYISPNINMKSISIKVNKSTNFKIKTEDSIDPWF